MPSLKLSLLLVMFLILTPQFFMRATSVQISRDNVTSASTDAENALASAYQAALDAEEAGANISSLVVQLNDAGAFLASARMKNSSEDFNEATHLATEVQSAAFELRDSARSEGLQRTMFAMITSVVGVALIALGSPWVWRFLRKRYTGDIS